MYVFVCVCVCFCCFCVGVVQLSERVCMCARLCVCVCVHELWPFATSLSPSLLLPLFCLLPVFPSICPLTLSPSPSFPLSSPLHPCCAHAPPPAHCCPFVGSQWQCCAVISHLHLYLSFSQTPSPPLHFTPLTPAPLILFTPAH